MVWKNKTVVTKNESCGLLKLEQKLIIIVHNFYKRTNLHLHVNQIKASLYYHVYNFILIKLKHEYFIILINLLYNIHECFIKY